MTYQLKYRGFELSSLMWKFYVQMDMLFQEIQGNIFSCTIFTTFSLNNCDSSVF
jgi:hypothetical protein